MSDDAPLRPMASRQSRPERCPSCDDNNVCGDAWHDVDNWDKRDAEILRHANIIEIAVRNETGSVSEYMNHWEGRAEKAEAEVSRLSHELEIVKATRIGMEVELEKAFQTFERVRGLARQWGDDGAHGSALREALVARAARPEQS